MSDEGGSHADFTVEIFNVQSLKAVSRTGNEVRYNCPLCEEKRGKADKDGKLYFNIAKQKGYCFKCHSSVYPEGTEDGRLDRDEIEWKKSIDALLRYYSDTIFDKIEFPTEVPFEFPKLSRDLLTYLKKRNPFLIPLKDHLGIQAWRGKDTGVVLPFYYKGKVCKFQCRFVTRAGEPLNPNDKMKYYTSPGPKPLYCPFHIFKDFHTVGRQKEELTICEGVFDAIALAVMGFPNPVAILGDKLTPLQMWDIRHLTPIISKIYLCLDDVQRSEHIGKLVKKFIPCVEETKVIADWAPGKDPEEFLRFAITQSEEVKKDMAQRVVDWIQTYDSIT